MTNLNLQDWQVCDPELRQDLLPQPYSLIAEALEETVLHRLDLALYHIDQKHKDPNYQGPVKDYLSQNCIDIDSVSCISDHPNQHNHLFAGDKKGTLYLLDLAKKVVFSKKELVPGKRITSISQSVLTDGENTFTTAAVIFNGHPNVVIVRYRHGQQKIITTHEVQVTKSDNCNQFPYCCQWDDYSRLLIVHTFEGSILIYRVPEITLDLDAINRNQTIPLEEEDFKKKLRYPFSYAVIQSEVQIIQDLFVRIGFEGVKNGGKTQLNPAIEKPNPEIFNGQDNTPSYTLPKYKPFTWILHCRVQLPKKKAFQKGRFIDVPHQIIYGWTNSKIFYVSQLYSKQSTRCPHHIYIQHFLQRVPQNFLTQKQLIEKQTTITNTKRLKTIANITYTRLSQPDELYLGIGMSNGSTAVWSTSSLNILLTTQKHQGAVSALDFFEGWKIVSGSSQGSLHIDNILIGTNEVKRTNAFESKFHNAITSIKISYLGLCFVLDELSNLRVYDLWRNQKIAKAQPSNNFSLLENKGKKWLGTANIKPSQALYSNHDFTVAISTHWPNYTDRQLQDSLDKQETINLLKNNFWRCKSTHLHIIRNFQLILSLFEGLQSTYKKGYDRKKIENLFSNLQFAQLYDRTFEIPDFGHSNPLKKTENADKNKFKHVTSSQSSSWSKNRMKDTSSGKSQVNQAVTKEVLHPEKFLLERRKVGGVQVLNEQKLQGTMLESLRRQEALQNAFQNTLSKGTL